MPTMVAGDHYPLRLPEVGQLGLAERAVSLDRTLGT
jgi:hypothetical protein